MDRRSFLQLLGSGIGTAVLSGSIGCTEIHDNPKILKSQPLTGKGKAFLFLGAANGKTSALRVVDWNSFDYLDIPIPLTLPHSLVQDPHDRDNLFIFEALGSCVKVNLESKNVQKVDHTQSRQMFFGHGILSPANDLLLCSEMDQTLAYSRVTMRDPHDLQLLRFAPEECNGTHQLVRMPHTSIIACGNLSGRGGKKGGGITFLDSSTMSVVEKADLDYPVLHMLPLAKDELLGVCLPPELSQRSSHATVDYLKTSAENDPVPILKKVGVTTAPLIHLKRGEAPKLLWDKSDLDRLHFNFGAASLATQTASHSDTVFLTSHLTSHCVVLWRNFKIVKSIPVPAPSNLIVSADGSEFMVASDGSAKVFSLPSLSEVRTMADERKIVTIAAYQNG